MSTYFFIDGGYLRARHADQTKQWFGDELPFDFSSVMMKLSSLVGTLVWQPIDHFTQVKETPNKSFYYDCLDEERGQSESLSDFTSRIKKQDALIENIRNVNGCHIRLGTLKGSKKIKRQKEVDILLAVDMITHAAQRNMTKAVLFAGDQDFKPVVESLVQLGIFVHIIADAKRTSRELTWAASSYTKLTFEDFYYWIPESARLQNPIPECRNYKPKFEEEKLVKEGLIGEHRCKLYETSDSYMIHLKKNNYTDNTYEHKELDRLELYFALQDSPIIWD